MNILVGKKIASKVVNFLKAIQEAKVSVSINNSFRKTDQQKELYEDKANNFNPVVKPGESRHKSGFAINFYGVNNLAQKQKEDLNKSAKDNNFFPLDGDPHHFDADSIIGLLIFFDYVHDRRSTIFNTAIVTFLRENDWYALRIFYKTTSATTPNTDALSFGR